MPMQTEDEIEKFEQGQMNDKFEIDDKEYRLSAIEAAAKLFPTGGTAEQLIEAAEKIANFIINGAQEKTDVVGK